jgi:hypothetical protein
MDTILFLETIVYFHSYTRYKALHTGRTRDLGLGMAEHYVKSDVQLRIESRE